MDVCFASPRFLIDYTCSTTVKVFGAPSVLFHCPSFPSVYLIRACCPCLYRSLLCPIGSSIFTAVSFLPPQIISSKKIPAWCNKLYPKGLTTGGETETSIWDVLGQARNLSWACLDFRRIPEDITKWWVQQSRIRAHLWVLAQFTTGFCKTNSSVYMSSNRW